VTGVMGVADAIIVYSRPQQAAEGFEPYPPAVTSANRGAPGSGATRAAVAT
jgi:hypothetical protein